MHEADSSGPVLASRAQRFVTLMGVVGPFIGLIAAIIFLWGWGIHWTEVSLLAVMYLATGLGVTVGFHRLFTHRSFQVVAPVKLLFAVLGSMSVQGPLLKWVANHRRHHQHSDQELDPHSPHAYGGGVRGVIRGFWHSHVAWLFAPEPVDLDRYVGDLKSDPMLNRTSQLFGLWVLLGLLIPAVLGGLISGTWFGALLGFIWGGLVRIFLLHHVTWSINSVCHLWGRKPFRGEDESRNNAIFGILALGEGWHNNHHAFPTSARHGLRWWEFDFSYVVIMVLKGLGMAWDVRVPSPQTITAKLQSPVAEGEAPVCSVLQRSQPTT